MPLSVSSLRAAFMRSGRPGAHTNLLEAAPAEIIEAVNRAKNDEPNATHLVIVSWLSVDDWVAITPTGLLACDGKRIRQIQASDISRVTPIMVQNGRRIHKTELTQLRVDVKDGTSILIHADAGAPFSGIWNVLKALERAAPD